MAAEADCTGHVGVIGTISSQHILVKKTLVKKDTWQKEVIPDTWQKAVCKWYQKFSDKTSMNQILGKKFMEWILVKIKTLE